MRLVLVTKEKAIKNIFNGSNYDVVGVLDNKATLIEDIKDINPQVAVVIEGFDYSGISTPILLTKLKSNIPSLRIVYVAGNIEANETILEEIKQLINAGVYDIITGDKVNTADILERLDNPRTFEDVKYILDLKMEGFAESMKTLFVVSSLKPGTGKTFLATNLAVAIAKYGQDIKGPKGTLRRPMVCIIDGDLTSLNVSTILSVDNYDRNMLKALKQIAKYVDENGEYNITDSEMDELKRFVRRQVVRYKDIDNLYCMVAPEISQTELASIYPAHFYFLVQMVVNAFDVIIVDTNSSLDHQTTGLLYDMAGSIFLMMDNDYNNIQNNLRYIGELKQYQSKLHFLVNKDLTEEMERMCLENLDYETKNIGDLFIEYRIPLVDAGIVKGLEYNNELLVTSKRPEVETARKAILDIANSILKIDKDRI